MEGSWDWHLSVLLSTMCSCLSCQRWTKKEGYQNKMTAASTPKWLLQTMDNKMWHFHTMRSIFQFSWNHLKRTILSTPSSSNLWSAFNSLNSIKSVWALSLLIWFIATRNSLDYLKIFLVLSLTPLNRKAMVNSGWIFPQQN